MGVWIGWAFLALVWGTTWGAIKVGLEDLPPVSFAGIRFGIAAAVLWGLVIGTRRSLPDRSGWMLIAGTALVTISLQYALQFWGQQHVASGLSSVISATIPVFTAVFAHRSLSAERLTLRGSAGILLGLGGVAVIFSDQLFSEGRLALLGSVALVVAAAATSRAQVHVKAFAGGIDPIVFTWGQFTVGCVPLLLAGWLTEGPPTTFDWTRDAVGALLYLAVMGSAVAFGVMYWLFRRMAVTKVMTVGFVNPLVALAVGWFFLDEALTLRAALGGGAVLTGVGLVLFARPPRPVPLREG